MARSTAPDTWTVAAALLMVAAIAAEPALGADFYAGKTITMSTYGSPGDSYDLYLRLLSRHYGKHIPVNPRFVVINQPGRQARGHEPRRRAGAAGRHLPHPRESGPPDIRSDRAARPAGLKWLGSFAQSNNVTVTWYISRTRTLQDAIDHEVVVGASGAGGGSVIGPAIYNAVLGTKFKVVYGYQGAAIDLAMQRGEVEGRGNNTWPATRRRSRAPSRSTSSTS
jgi:hypothetical protein